MRARPPTPEMNVTPLVDVVLVLLIIFMVIVPQMASGASVDVPAAQNFDPKKSKIEPLTLSITKQANVFIEKSRTDLTRLEAVLKRVRKRDPYRQVRIKADKLAPYGVVRTVFKTCQDVGFPGVGLQVGDKKKKKKAGGK